MVRNPEALRAFDDAAKAEWLSKLTVSSAFRLAEEMHGFSHFMSPASFSAPKDAAALLQDDHILVLQRVCAAFRAVKPRA